MVTPPTQLVSSDLPHDLIRDIIARDAVLWVGAGFDHDAGSTAGVAELAALPWKLVLLESTRGLLAVATAAQTQTADRFARLRGFVHVIAENPTELTRSPRSLPVYLLNGRDDATSKSEAVHPPTTRPAMLRRFNMQREAQKACPKVLVVLADAGGAALDEAIALWGEDGFAPRLVVVDPADTCGPAVDGWLTRRPGRSNVA